MMTLRRKIVSLTLCVLLLFMATAAASLLLQSEISEQFSGVVDDYLPLNAAVATIDVFTDRYELDLMRLAAGLREGGVGAGALVQQGEAERLHQAGVLTTTFQTAEEQLNQFVQDPRASIDKRVAMADIRGRFGYMPRALPNFIEVGRRMSEALSAGRVEEAARIAAGFAPYRSLFGEDLTAVRDELAALTASAAGEAHRLNRGLTILEIVMLGLASLLGISVSMTVSNRMMAGLERLIQGTRQVQDGHGYEMLPVTSNDEIGKLTVAFNHMVEDLRAKDRIKETFGKFVDPRIVANLLDPAGGKDLAERQVATVFFSDIKGFSGLGELLTATTLVKLLNTYFSEMTAPQRHYRQVCRRWADGVLDGALLAGREPCHRRLPRRPGAAASDPGAAGTLIRCPWPAPRPAGVQCAYGPRHRRSGGRDDRLDGSPVFYGNRRYRQPCFAP